MEIVLNKNVAFSEITESGCKDKLIYCYDTKSVIKISQEYVAKICDGKFSDLPQDLFLALLQNEVILSVDEYEIHEEMCNLLARGNGINKMIVHWELGCCDILTHQPLEDLNEKVEVKFVLSINEDNLSRHNFGIIGKLTDIMKFLLKIKASKKVLKIMLDLREKYSIINLSNIYSFILCNSEKINIELAFLFEEESWRRMGFDWLKALKLLNNETFSFFLRSKSQDLDCLEEQRLIQCLYENHIFISYLEKVYVIRYDAQFAKDTSLQVAKEIESFLKFYSIKDITNMKLKLNYAAKRLKLII